MQSSPIRDAQSVPDNTGVAETRADVMEFLDEIEDWFFCDSVDYELPTEETMQATRDIVNMICDYKEELADRIELGPEDDGVIDVTLFRNMGPTCNGYTKYWIFAVTVGEGAKISVHNYYGAGGISELSKYASPQEMGADRLAEHLNAFLCDMREYQAPREE